jgi:3D (Asp-Asp-Asp) domain-containing protein
MKQFPFAVFLLLILVLAPERAFAYRNPPATSRLIIATVTAYTSRPSAATASGTPGFEGVVACPRKYPFGTRVMIEGRIYECRDRLNRKYDDRFDIWKPTRAAARLFGKRQRFVAAVIPMSPAMLVTGGAPVRLSRY